MKQSKKRFFSFINKVKVINNFLLTVIYTPAVIYSIKWRENIKFKLNTKY